MPQFTKRKQQTDREDVEHLPSKFGDIVSGGYSAMLACSCSMPPGGWTADCRIVTDYY